MMLKKDQLLMQWRDYEHFSNQWTKPESVGNA
jgi:hypothetical protein